MRYQRYFRAFVGPAVCMAAFLTASCDRFWPLDAVISVEPVTSGYAPLTLSFGAGYSKGPISARDWNFGDPASGANNLSDSVLTNHTFQDDGIYTVTLRIFTDDGDSDLATVQITVLNPPPLPQLHASPSRGAAPLAVTFDLSSSIDPAGIVPGPTGEIVSFVLDFGDGSVPLVGNDLGIPVLHTYSNPEYRIASLTVIDDDGASASTTSPVAVEGAADAFNTPGYNPAGLAYDGSHLWLSDWSALRIYKIRASDGQVIFSFDAPGEPMAPLALKSEPAAIVPGPPALVGVPGGLAWGDGALWVACLSDGKIYKLNPSLPTTSPGHVLGVLENAAFTPFALAYGGGSLWVSDLANGRIYRVDPASGVVIGFFDGPGIAPHALKALSPQGIVSIAPMGLAWDDGVLWIASGSTLYKVNPSNGSILESIPSPGPTPYGLAHDGRYLWNSDQNGSNLGRLYRLVVG